MRKLHLTLFFSLFSVLLFAQGIAVNNSGAVAHSSAMLDVSSTTKGILTPRMSESQRTAISQPANGLLVYQTDATKGFYYNSGTAEAPVWTRLDSASAPVAFSVTTNSFQNFPQAGAKLLFTLKEYDESSNFNMAQSEFTAPAAGLYHFDLTVVFQGNNGSRYDLSLYVNGAQKKTVLGTITGLGYMTLVLSADLKLAAGDKVDARLAAPLGGNGSVLQGSSPYIWFNGRRAF